MEDDLPPEVVELRPDPHLSWPHQLDFVKRNYQFQHQKRDTPYVDPKEFPCLSAPSSEYFVQIKGHVSMQYDDTLHDQRIGRSDYTMAEIRRAMNYGTQPIFGEISGEMERLARDSFNKSLVLDLVSCLYPHSGWGIEPETPVLHQAIHFQKAQTSEQDRVLTALLDAIRDYSPIGRRLFPFSFHVVNIVRYVQYLAGNLNSSNNGEEDFRSIMTNFWIAKWPLVAKEELKWGLYQAEKNVKHALGLETLRGGWFHDREMLRKQFRMEGKPGAETRTLVLTAVGLNSETSEMGLLGPLDYFTASNLHRGPFEIELTPHPSQHLKLRRVLEPQPKLLLLNQRAIFHLYTLQHSGIASAAGIPSLFVELLYSHILFFCQDAMSIQAGKDLEIDTELMREFYRAYVVSDTDTVTDALRFEDFPIYGTRLRELRDRMNSWRPRTIRGKLFTRPYDDPLSFYAVWFGSIISLVTILTFGVALAGAYSTFRAIPNG